MKSVDCPQHGDTVLHLARGHAGPGQAERAESIRTSCDHCSAWWQRELEGERYREIEASVERAIRGFSPPQHRRRAGKDFLVAAACLTLAAGVVFLSPDRGEMPDREATADDRVASSAVESAEATRDSDLILSEGFETVTGAPATAFSTLVEVAGDDLSEEGLAATERRRTDVVLSSDFELGSLQDWSEHSGP